MVVKKPKRKIKNVKVENWDGTVEYGYAFVENGDDMVECGNDMVEYRYARFGLIFIFAVFDF